MDTGLKLSQPVNKYPSIVKGTVMFKAKIHYLFHDGFIVETESHILIFDYFNDKSDSGRRSLIDGVISEEVFKTEKSICVFVSHNHGDHFNPLIFNWKEYNSKIQYILSSDVEIKDNYPQYKIISEGDSIEFDHIYIKAYGSTDVGISFYIKVDGISIFHAGDLNLWHWNDESDEYNSQMTDAFNAHIEKLKHEKIDMAFFPVDPRLEEHYFLGGKYFIENLSPKLFIPMHFGDNTKITSDFAEKLKGINSTTKIITIGKRGQEILF